MPEQSKESKATAEWVCFWLFPTWNRLTFFSKQAVWFADRKRPWRTALGVSESLRAFCLMPSPPRGGHRQGGRNLLVAPGPFTPLHPRVPQSDQPLWTAPEIHLQGPTHKKATESPHPRLRPAILVCTCVDLRSNSSKAPKHVFFSHIFRP